MPGSLQINNSCLKILVVVFDFKLKHNEIPAFRASVIEKVGKENILFHNHLKEKQYVYGYPLIQYKSLHGNAAMVCLNEGSEEILKFFEKTNWDLYIHEKPIKTEIKNIFYEYFDCSFCVSPIFYSIYNWFALNENNYIKYFDIDSEKLKLRFLENLLIGNILSFGKGIRWNFNEKIHVTIKKIINTKDFFFKKKKMIGFTVNFKTNISIPNYIGLGKSVSRGFGVIEREEKYGNNNFDWRPVC